MEQTLLLNATYEPLKIVHWQKAVTLWVQGKVEIISVYDREVRAVSFTFSAAVGHSTAAARDESGANSTMSRSRVPTSTRATITPASTAATSSPTADLTFDHVVPVAQGGRKDWENIVTCCITCNRRKGGRTPEQAHMRLDPASAPAGRAPALRITIGLRDTPETWRDYLYWNVELDETTEVVASGSRQRRCPWKRDDWDKSRSAAPDWPGARSAQIGNL